MLLLIELGLKQILIYLADQKNIEHYFEFFFKNLKNNI